MDNKTFAVVANCQTGPLSLLIEKIAPSLKRIPLKAIHTLTENNSSEFYSKLEGCDIIIHQPIGSAFGGVSMESIKRKFPSKKFISFPSIYFDGYFPNLMYLRKPGGGTLKGVIGDYHDARVVSSFLQGKTTTETVNLIKTRVTHEKALMQIESAINRLEIKEQELDVHLSSFIKERVLKERLFYVFNHPTNMLLIEVAKQVCNRLDIIVDDESLANAEKVTDYLVGCQAAIDVSISDLIELSSENDLTYVTRNNDVSTYSLEQYVSKQFDFYDNEPSLRTIFDYAIERRKKIGY